MKREDFIEIKEKYFKTCEELEKNGKCYEVYCYACPFSYANSAEGLSCITKGYASQGNKYDEDCKLKKSAKEFILKFKEEKMLEGKFRCVETVWEDFMKKGEIYEFKKGHVTKENGNTSLFYRDLKNFHEWNRDFKIEEIKEFTKDDLKDGMIVETRDGDRCIKLNDKLVGRCSHLELDHYNIKLIDKDDAKYDVVKVYKSTTYRLDMMFGNDQLELIWEREELSPEQVEMQKLEDEMRVLADKMKKLKEEM